MRVKNLLQSCLFVLAAGLPARADVLLSYHISSFNPPTQGDTLTTGTPIPANDPLGPLITGPLVFYPGQTRYIQVAISANANAPTMVNGQNQFNWTTADVGNTLLSFGFLFNYPASLVVQPFTHFTGPPGNNAPNANAASGPQPAGGGPTGYAFRVGHGGFNQYPGPYTVLTGLDLNIGLGVEPSGLMSPTILAVFKVRAGTGVGSGFITMTDLNPALTSPSFALLDDTNLDPIIFTPAHNNFPLQVSVVVPEPSSLVFAGLAVAGLGWRKWRGRGGHRLDHN